MGAYLTAFPDSFTTYDSPDAAVTAIKTVQRAHPRTMAVYLVTKVIDCPVAPLVGAPPPKRTA